MVRSQKHPTAACHPAKRSPDANRRPNVRGDRHDVVFLSDTFDMTPGADWSNLSQRVSRGQPIRGMRV